jgi:hypothetical protein
VPRHSHTHGAGFRVVIEGSLVVNGTELTPKDWMYVPKGHPYGFEVGARGVSLMAAYEC